MKTRNKIVLRFIVGVVFVMWVAELNDAIQADGPTVDYVISIGGMVFCAAVAALSFKRPRSTDPEKRLPKSDEHS
jgi:hypothetical protein